jgi:hypothetical protein
MKQIPLTRGKVALVDDEDFDKLVAFGKWCVNSYGYAVKTKKHKNTNGKWATKVFFMHRLIMGLSLGDGVVVDHINNEKLDCRRCNLRLCSVAENNRNVGLRKDNTSFYKGVSFDKARGKFQARIMFENKIIYLGRFKDPKEAAVAYNAAALKYFGEFATLNKVNI